jgi:hypothetical protein
MMVGEDEEGNDIDKCEKDFAAACNHDSISAVGCSECMFTDLNL